MMIVRNDEDSKAMALMQAKTNLDEAFDEANELGVVVRYGNFNGDQFSLVCEGDKCEFLEDKYGYEDATSWIQNKVRNKNSLESISFRQAKSDFNEMFNKSKEAGIDTHFEGFRMNTYNQPCFELSCNGEVRSFSESKQGYENATFWMQDIVKDNVGTLDASSEERE